MSKPVVLLVLDGVGVSNETRGNAVAAAEKPNLRKIGENFPGTKLQASGIAVGLPWGEVGSSEVGHANLGAGFVIYQNYPRVSLAIQDKSFFKLPTWEKALERPNIHIMGLVTDSGIHAHIDHLLGLIKMLAMKKYRGGFFLHLFTDGEDAPPRSALSFLQKIQEALKKNRIGAIASVTGRHWAMDRGQNWDRTERTLKCLTEGQGLTAASAEEAIQNAYKTGNGDEMIEPTAIIDNNGRPVGLLGRGDAAIFFNIRPDRARQLTELLIKLPDIRVITMVQYEEGYPVEIVFPPQHITHPLAKIISDAGKTQLHIAESEKYAHATYFFNGGWEAPFPGEERMVIPSPKVPSYTEKPEMSAYEITDKLLEYLDSRKYDFLMVNFANGDMMGHTGNLKAAAKALETIDKCVGKIMEKVLALDGAMIITADHGNCEEMINLKTGQPDTEHSVNPVPFYLIGNAYRLPASPIGQSGEPAGILADVAPTILELMDVPKPKLMSGQSLLNLSGKLIL